LIFFKVSETDENEEAPTKAIDIINKKISKLDNLFAEMKLVKMRGRPSSYEIQPDMKTRDEMALAAGIGDAF
jgi:hypothetical protein